MNKVQVKRCLNVAKALREADAASKAKFTMEFFIYGQESMIGYHRDVNGDVTSYNAEENFCGTPACALGHYASRTDLQKLMKIAIKKDERGAKYADLEFTKGTKYIDFSNPRLQEHFGLDGRDLEKLFGWDGCGMAKTPLQAAKYIERFVKQKQYPGRDRS